MRFFTGLVLLLLVSVTTSGSAQTWTQEQQQIWKLEEEMWRRDTAKGLTWIASFWHADATSWGIDTPVPRNRRASRSLSGVLEIVAGDGVVKRALASGLPESVSIIATDVNQVMLDHARGVQATGPHFFHL